MQHDSNVSRVVLSQVRPLTIWQGQNAGAKMAMMTLQDLTDMAVSSSAMGTQMCHHP